MDIEQYIASGILEAYVLGQVSEQEEREVQCLSSIYPEIKEALLIAEADAERFARAYAKKAPESLRTRLMEEVKHITPQEPAGTHATAAATEAAPEAKVIDIAAPAEATQEQKRSYTHIWWAAAAGLIAVFALQQYFENQSMLNDVQAGREAFAKIESELNDLRSETTELQDMLASINRPGVKKVVLEPVSEQHSAVLALFWDTSSGAVILDAAALPLAPEGKQYQLWVLKDGVPIDMGVLPLDAQGMLTAQATALEGDAFAITLEPEGGLPSPSLDQLVVLGNIG